MKTLISTPKDKVINYYSTFESRAIYFVLKGVKHFGYYQEGQENIPVLEAQRLMIERIFEKLNLKSGSLLLDAGCGEGETAIYLARKYQIKARGIDILNFNIEKANKKRVDLGLEDEVDFQIMDYANTNFPNETFDAILALETVVHAVDYKNVLKEFYRILKPGGKLSMLEYSMPSLDDFPSDLRNIAEIIIKESGMHSLPYFLHGKFPEILKNAGFSDITVENVTQRVVTMFRKYYTFFWFPYQIIRLFKLQKKFVNITSAVEGYQNFIPNDLWRENIITAIRF